MNDIEKELNAHLMRLIMEDRIYTSQLFGRKGGDNVVRMLPRPFFDREKKPLVKKPGHVTVVNFFR